MPDVAIVGLHQSGLHLDKQEALAKQLVALMEASGKVRGLVDGQVVGTFQGREQILLQEGLLGPGRAKLQAGIDLYNQAQPEAALSLLGEAIFLLERAFPGTVSVDDLWSAHLYTGSASLQQGDDGSISFEAAASLAPDRSPDPARFPPDVVQAYEDARGRLKEGARDLTVKLTSVVPVFVDGVERGLAPAKAPGLLPGVHHIVARGARGSRGYKRVVVEPSSQEDDNAMKVNVALEEPFLGTPGPSRAERAAQTASLYRSLGTRAAGVEFVLLGGVDGESLHLQLYHAPSDSFSRAVEVPYTEWADDEAVAAVPLLLNLVDGDGLKATTDDVAPLDIGSNTALASLLLDPPDAQPLDGRKAKDDGKKRGGLVLGIVAGAALVGLAGGGVYLATQQGGGGGTTTTTTPPTTPILSSGTVVIDF